MARGKENHLVSNHHLEICVHEIEYQTDVGFMAQDIQQPNEIGMMQLLW